ncbi:MAG TPA: ATP-binding cassette domain-containing protein [Verrucomicrobiae bacterium]|nr:ATP-binding cassette domain-containing protein [Verrucomicrobiae bacterium]
MEQDNSSAKTPAILMRDVTVGALNDPATAVLRDVNWEVRPGDFWVLAGLQGEGKSDLLMLTAGLMPPLAGEYLFFGEPMPIFDEARLPHRLRLGLVFETGQLFNQLTVRENVALPLCYHRNLSQSEAAPTVQTLLDQMELGPWADSTPGSLGRNWHKRVGLARALILKPDALLLDNPLGGLDLRHVYWWLHFLQQLSKGSSTLRPEPITLVATTADLRPWMEPGEKFGIVKNQTLNVVGSRAQVEAAKRELVGELMAPIAQ